MTGRITSRMCTSRRSCACPAQRRRHVEARNRAAAPLRRRSRAPCGRPSSAALGAATCWPYSMSTARSSRPMSSSTTYGCDCARLRVRDGRLTGDLQSPPPAGEARGALLEEYASRNGVALAESFAYADSLSDLPKLELVGTPVAVNPDARLSQMAGQRGWRIERWRMAPGN